MLDINEPWPGRQTWLKYLRTALMSNIFQTTTRLNREAHATILKMNSEERKPLKKVNDFAFKMEEDDVTILFCFGMAAAPYKGSHIGALVNYQVRIISQDEIIVDTRYEMNIRENRRYSGLDHISQKVPKKLGISYSVEMVRTDEHVPDYNAHRLHNEMDKMNLPIEFLEYHLKLKEYEEAITHFLRSHILNIAPPSNVKYHAIPL